MTEKGMKINVVTYNAAISALAKTARQNVRQSLGDDITRIDEQQLWKRALSLMNQMSRDRVWPDVYSYSAAISACGSGGCWKEALSLIKRMKSGPSKLRPNRISYTGAISKNSRLVLLLILFCTVNSLAFSPT